jgi:hypothetical protein
MIRTLVKLVIVALVLNACYRVGSAYWEHYQFEDAVQELTQFGERSAPADLKEQILDLASSRGIPIDGDSLAVTRERRKITVDGEYARDLALFPRYKRRWEFNVHVVVLTLN